MIATIDGKKVQMQRTGQNLNRLWTAPWKPKTDTEGTVRIDVITALGNSSTSHEYKTNYNSIKSSTVSLLQTIDNSIHKIICSHNGYLVFHYRNIYTFCWFLCLFCSCLLARVINTSFLHVFNVQILFPAFHRPSGTRGKHNIHLLIFYDSINDIVFTSWW